VTPAAAVNTTLANTAATLTTAMNKTAVMPTAFVAKNVSKTNWTTKFNEINATKT
jgi:hypothetical protein